MIHCHTCEMHRPSLNFCTKTNYKNFDKQISSNSYINLMYKFFQSCSPISDGVKNVFNTSRCKTVRHPILMKLQFLGAISNSRFPDRDPLSQLHFSFCIGPMTKTQSTVCEANQEDKSSRVQRTGVTLNLRYLPIGSVLSSVCSLCSISSSNVGKQQKLSQGWTRLSTCRRESPTSITHYSYSQSLYSQHTLKILARMLKFLSRTFLKGCELWLISVATETEL